MKEVDTKQVGNFITRFFDRIVELAESPAWRIKGFLWKGHFMYKVLLVDDES